MDSHLILHIISLILSILTVIICGFILLSIFIRVRPLTTNVPMILNCHTYFTLLLESSMMLIQYAYYIVGYVTSSKSINNYLCELRAYFSTTFICAFYYSCVLQATFRLFRVVLHRHRKLQSNMIFLGLIIAQWSISFIHILIHLLLHDFQYVPAAINCLISFDNVRGIFAGFIVVRFIPLLIIFAMYIYMIRYIRQAVQVEIRQNHNRRDVVVIKRIILIVIITIGMGIPSGFILINYLITNYLSPVAYGIQGLCESFGFIVASITFIFTTSHLQEIFHFKKDLNPNTVTTALSTR